MVADGVADYDGDDFALGDGGQGAGLAEHFQRDLPHAIGGQFCDHPDGPVSAGVVGQIRVVGVLPAVRGEGCQAFAEMLGNLAGRFLRCFVSDHHAQAVGFHEADVLNPGGRTLQPEQREIIGEVGAGELLDGFFLRLCHLLATGVAFLAGSLGNAHHGGKCALQHLVALVGGAFHR